MKFFSEIKTIRGNIVYDEKEMSLNKYSKDYSLASAGAAFLVFSAGLNLYTYINQELYKGLLFVVPLVIISLSYLTFNLIQLIQSLRFKEVWHEYSYIKNVKIKEKGDNAIVEFQYNDNNYQRIIISNDLYFKQFVSTLVKNRVDLVFD
jgi:hypothetical protein